MIKFKCEFCDQRLGVPDEFVGKRVRCTKCRAVNTVPSPEELEARATAKLAASPQASLPEDPVHSTADQTRLARNNSILDLSSASGSFAGGILPPHTDSVSGMTESKIFGTKKDPAPFTPGKGDFPTLTDSAGGSGLLDSSGVKGAEKKVEGAPSDDKKAAVAPQPKGEDINLDGLGF